MVVVSDERAEAGLLQRDMVMQKNKSSDRSMEVELPAFFDNYEMDEDIFIYKHRERMRGRERDNQRMKRKR